MNITKTTGGAIYLAVIMLALPGWSGEKKREKGEKAEKTAPAQVEPETIGLFAAIGDGKISVAVVPQSFSALTLRVRNNTRSPLKVELPATIAAVPTARLQAVRGMQAGQTPMSLAKGYGYGQDQGGSQGLGGSLGGPWSGGTFAQDNDAQGDSAKGNRAPGDQQPAPAGPRYWTLAPRQIFQTQIPCFCLEFGKPDPTSRIPYQLCPLQDLNSRSAVEELLEQFAKRGINQFVAQLAAWHVANDVPWQMLTKVQFPRTPSSRGHRVTPMELMAAKQLAESLPSYGQPASLGK